MILHFTVRESRSTPDSPCKTPSSSYLEGVFLWGKLGILCGLGTVNSEKRTSGRAPSGDNYIKNDARFTLLFLYLSDATHFLNLRTNILVSSLSHLLLPAILGFLYLTLWSEAGSVAGKAFFLVHIGLFILWQPFVRKGQRISFLTAVFGLAILATTLIWLDGWVLVLWIIILISILGGKIPLFGERNLRLANLYCFSSLAVALLLIAVPSALPAAKLPEALVWLGYAGTLAPIFLMIPLLKPSELNREDNVVDFIHSLIVMLTLALLVFGSLVLMLLVGSSYVKALLQSISIIAIVLLILGWAWNPRAGFAGLGNLLSRYLMSIGLPMDQWLAMLTDLAFQEDDPEVFLEKACCNMAQYLPWVLGITWEADRESGQYGIMNGYCSVFHYEELTLHLYTQYQLTTTLYFHFNLPTRLLLKFYIDKKRDIAFKKISYMQAIHETGARLTHDIKNILQTLNALCVAVNEPHEEFSEAYQALLRRQLPAISNRLAETIDKLKTPQESKKIRLSSAQEWVNSFQQRVAGNDWISIDASSVIGDLPEDLFSTVTENLIQNAEDKYQRNTELLVTIRISTSNYGTTLELSDNGEKIEDKTLKDLFSRPVPSSKGLGIGLMQAAQYAETMGYKLTLAENRMGRVSFRLAPVLGYPYERG
ncbi:MAG TPA: ATP-binding protein [Rugosibacter sp.]